MALTTGRMISLGTNRLQVETSDSNTILDILFSAHGAFLENLFCFVVFNATFFNNISVISGWSVILVKGTGVNHRPVASHSQTLSHNVVKRLFLIQCV